VTNEPASILDEIDEVIVIASVGNRGPLPATASLNTSGNPAGQHQAAPHSPMITTPMLNNSGRIRPGGPGRAGPFNLTGNLVQTSQGRIQIELGGAAAITQHDQVRLYDGSAALAGTLEVRLIDGFKPQAGQQFVILLLSGDNAGISGEFDSIVAQEGLSVSATYLADRVILTVDAFIAPEFSLRRDGNELEITWTLGQLETSTSVTGPWELLESAVSPYRIVPQEMQRFYKIRQNASPASSHY
jgi:hypothetical protein